MAQLLSQALGATNGAGVWGSGQRNSYAMLSYNTTQSVGGLCFYDQAFGIGASPNGYPSGYSNYSASNVIYMDASTNANYSSIFYSVTSTATQASSNGTSTYMNATNSSGEFGNALIDVFSDNTYRATPSRGSSAYQEKHYLNACAINSDHANKRNVYILYSGAVRCVDRLYGSYQYPKYGTNDFTVSSLTTSMTGSASYNAVRKEMIILSYSSSGGAFNVIKYTNLDLNKYQNPAVAFARPEVVRTNSTVSLSSSWNVNNEESYYNLKPVLCDNGTILVTVFFTSNNIALYSFTTDGTNAVTASYLTGSSVTTSYGKDQGIDYGLRAQTSRDGKTVAIQCPYYYYGSGIRCYMINRKNATYTLHSNNSTSAGQMVLPWGNDGWAFYFCGNSYAGNYGGGYITSWYYPATSGFGAYGSTMYMPQFTNPNTTNYPSMTQVTDYVLLEGDNFGPHQTR